MNAFRPLTWVRDACTTMLSALLPVYKDSRKAYGLSPELSGHTDVKVGVPTSSGKTKPSEPVSGISREDLLDALTLSAWDSPLLTLDRYTAHLSSATGVSTSQQLGQGPNT